MRSVPVRARGQETDCVGVGFAKPSLASFCWHAALNGAFANSTTGTGSLPLSSTACSFAKAAKLDMSSKKMTPARAAKQSPNYPHASDKLYENKSVLAFEMPCSYRTQRIKVDTKDFGLPQTRRRFFIVGMRGHSPQRFDSHTATSHATLHGILEFENAT